MSDDFDRDRDRDRVRMSGGSGRGMSTATLNREMTMAWMTDIRGKVSTIEKDQTDHRREVNDTVHRVELKAEQLEEENKSLKETISNMEKDFKEKLTNLEKEILVVKTKAGVLGTAGGAGLGGVIALIAKFFG